MANDVFGILRPALQDRRKTVIVLGTPRGGTSMVAAVLRKLGVMMGEKLGNQHEDPNFRREVPLSDMIATVERRNASHDLWGWKLPNSVYYVEQLLPYLRNPHFIAVFRNPYSVSRSSSERDRRDYEMRLLQVAANHTKLVVDLIGRLDAPTALSSFEAVLKEPESFVRDAAAFVGVEADDELLRRVVIDAVNPNLGYVRFNAAGAAERPNGNPPPATARPEPIASAMAHARVAPAIAARRGDPAFMPAREARMRVERPGAERPVRTPAPAANGNGNDNPRRAERAVRVPPAARNLPTTISNPFFQELQTRWREVPTIGEPVSQMCTTSQFGERAYDRVRSLLRLPRHLHRKQWEFVYIYRSVEQAGLVGSGYRGLVFGVGREKLPSLFVAKGCRIVATDLPVEEGDGRWVGGAQHADSLDKIYYPPIVGRDEFYANASYRPVNMNAIPADLEGFDFCWSACALEHLGSLELGLDFIRNSMKCLKPGGVAVHTTEFNLGSGTETLEDGPSVVYRERDLVDFARELQDEGHEIILNLHPGAEPTDRMVDRDRNSDIHLRLYARHRVLATSCGLCIRKAV